MGGRQAHLRRFLTSGHIRTLAIICAIMLMICGNSNLSMAADITVVDRSTELTFIGIEGEFKYGDEKKFAEIALQHPQAVIMFNSPGGNALAGVEIGKAIRLRGYSTYVPDDALCASACGFAWLAGTKRYMARSAKIGFHAVYVMDGDQSRETGAGNALVGAYLNTLGLSEPTILYVTSAPPNGMTWMSFEDASKAGIEVSLATEDEEAENPAQLSSDNKRPTNEEKSTPTTSAPKTSAPPSYAAAMGKKERKQTFFSRTMTGNAKNKDGLSQNECEASCRMDPACTAYTYDKWNNLCKSWDTRGDLLINPSSMTVIFSDRTVPDSSAPAKLVELRNQSFPNTPYVTRSSSTPMECASACMSQSICLGLTFHAETGDCRLFAAPNKALVQPNSVSAYKIQHGPDQQ